MREKVFVSTLHSDAKSLSFGEKLRHFRITAGFTQEALASELGVRQATLSNWEQNLQRPRPYMRARIHHMMENKDAHLLQQLLLHAPTPFAVIDKNDVVVARSNIAAQLNGEILNREMLFLNPNDDDFTDRTRLIENDIDVLNKIVPQHNEEIVFLKVKLWRIELMADPYIAAVFDMTTHEDYLNYRRRKCAATGAPEITN